MTSPTGEGAAAAEPVAEAAGGQQQAGEHQHVGVDDPLQLAGGGVEVARTEACGRATLRIVLSSPMTSRLRHSTARVHQRRRWTVAVVSTSMGRTYERPRATIARASVKVPTMGTLDTHRMAACPGPSPPPDRAYADRAGDGVPTLTRREAPPARRGRSGHRPASRAGAGTGGLRGRARRGRQSPPSTGWVPGGIDLVVLDLTLPDIDGLDVCRQIRPAIPRCRS